jgi:hypothetical protein
MFYQPYLKIRLEIMFLPSNLIQNKTNKVCFLPLKEADFVNGVQE